MAAHLHGVRFDEGWSRYKDGQEGLCKSVARRFVIGLWWLNGRELWPRSGHPLQNFGLERAKTAQVRRRLVRLWMTWKVVYEA